MSSDDDPDDLETIENRIDRMEQIAGIRQSIGLPPDSDPYTVLLARAERIQKLLRDCASVTAQFQGLEILFRAKYRTKFMRDFEDWDRLIDLFEATKTLTLTDQLGLQTMILEDAFQFARSIGVKEDDLLPDRLAFFSFKDIDPKIQKH